mgnify:FL=1
MPLGRRGFLGGLFGLGALPFIGRGEKAAPKREPQADDQVFQPLATWPDGPPKTVPRPVPKSKSGLDIYICDGSIRTELSLLVEGNGMPFYVTRVNGYLVPVCQFDGRDQVKFGPISFHEVKPTELRDGPLEDQTRSMESSTFFHKNDPTRCIEHFLATGKKQHYMWSPKFRSWMKVTQDVFDAGGDYDSRLAETWGAKRKKQSDAVSNTAISNDVTFESDGYVANCVKSSTPVEYPISEFCKG